jgi:hypothetical protein
LGGLKNGLFNSINQLLIPEEVAIPEIAPMESVKSIQAASFK